MELLEPLLEHLQATALEVEEARDGDSLAKRRKREREGEEGRGESSPTGKRERGRKRGRTVLGEFALQPWLGLWLPL